MPLPKDETKRCTALNVVGEACGAPPVEGTSLCYWHSEDPAVLAVMRKNGGRRKILPKEFVAADIKDIESILSIIQETIDELRQMDVTVPRQRTILTACETAMKAMELLDLTQRMEVLEESIKGGK